MTQKKKGFDVVDGEELFHMLHNPYYNDWKEKRGHYVKYEQLKKMQQAKHSRYPTFGSRLYDPRRT